MKKAVFFDLDDTLYDGTKPYQNGLVFLEEEWQKRYPNSLGNNNFQEMYGSARNAISMQSSLGWGVGNRAICLQKMVELADLPMDFAWIVDIEQKYWSKYLDESLLRDGALETVSKLKERNLGLVVITNLTTIIQMKKLIKFGLDKYIDFLITSEEAGAVKPSSAMFHSALHKTHCRPDEAIMVGDDIKPDILGAKLVGIDTVLIENGWYIYSDTERNLAKFRIKSFPELLQLI